MNMVQPILFSSSIADKTIAAGSIFICIACFFTPLSTSLMGIFSGLAVLCWLLSGQFLHISSYLKKYPATLVSLLLFLFMCLALSYSPAEVSEGITILKKYRELLLLPIVVSILSLSNRYRFLAETAFIWGCIALMMISYGIAFELIPEDRYGHSIVFHITHNFFMAVLSFWSLHSTASPGKFRWFWGVIFLLSVGNIFYVAPGRTGMFVFICLILLFMFQRLSIKYCIIGIIIFCTAITAVYYTSENFSGRLNRVVKEVNNYKPGKARTSIGQRFDWYRSGITLIKQKPIFGYGTGSYPYVQEMAVKGTRIKPTDNPHNEFLFLTIQFGFFGLLLFMALLVTQIFYARKVVPEKQMLLHGVILALVSGSLMNSLLFDSQQGHFYLFLSAALMTADSQVDTTRTT